MTPIDLPLAGEAPVVFPVAERFVSINGEGAHAGRLAAFIRFSGCNLECRYCDTVWAQDSELTVELATVSELVDWVSEQPCACVTITGGEPTLQTHLPELVFAFDALPSLEVIEIETNGSTDLSFLAADRPGKLRFTMDYKLPSSGMERRMRTENFALLAPHDVVKFVAGTSGDLDKMVGVIDEFGLMERCRVYVSPVFGQIDPAAIVEFMKARRLAGVTLQLQLHKIIWPGTERGV